MALLSMALWAGLFVFGVGPQPVHFAAMHWHAHEMIFGYALAAIAGFLLTAVPNWTKQKTPQGKALLAMFLLWASARILPFAGDAIPLAAVAIVDILFTLSLAAAIVVPIVKAKSWNNLVILAQLAIFTVSNVLYYTGHTLLGLYLAFYAVIAVVFIISRRILPMFIARGAGEPFQPKHYKWNDKSSLTVFLLFALADITSISSTLTATLAAALFVMHSFKLVGWHTRGIWKNPLLWVLYLGYAITVFGFAIKALGIFVGFSPYLAMHAFALGGIGMMTLGIMSRVSLGHTGRVVSHPPQSLGLIYGLMVCAVIFRVLIPIFEMSQYRLWIFISQVLWMTSFATFIAIYASIWVMPDKKSFE